MAITLAEIEAQALQLTPRERSELVHRLIVSLGAPVEDTPEAIAQAWDDEIERRVAEMDAGITTWTPADEAMRRIRERIAAAKAARAG